MGEAPAEAEACEAGGTREEVPEKGGIRRELRALTRLALPIQAVSMLSFSMQVVDMGMVGRLGSRELAAAALGNTCFFLINNPMNGALTALDTRLSMAYGAQELTIFGELLKAGLAMTLLACVPLGALLAGGGDLLELAGLDPDLTGLAGDYILRLLPGILPHFTFLCLTKYLQCQHILAPSVWIGVAANIVNVGLNYVFIFTLGLGFNGAPIATTLSRCCQLLMLLAYLYFNNQHKATWPRWFGLPRMKLAKELLHLAIPGFFMLGLETWAFEVSTLMAGYIDTTSLGAHTIMINVMGLLFLSLPFPLGIAASIRVGQLCGAQDVQAVRTTAYTALLIMVVVAVLCALFYVATGSVLGKAFSSDPAVIAQVAALAPIVALFQIPDACQAVLGGIYRGLGRQKLVAALNVVGFWIVGTPLGWALTFKAGLGVGGLWWGLNASLFCTCLLGGVLMCRMDWEKAVLLTKVAPPSTEETELTAKPLRLSASVEV